MSSAWLPDRPAFASGVRETSEPSEHQTIPDGLSELLGAPPTRLAMGPRDPFGYFRVGNVFVKVVPPGRGRRMIVADRLSAEVARHLPAEERGPRLLEGFPRRLSLEGSGYGHAWVLAYPWIDAEPPEPRTDALRALGGALARVHAALRRSKRAAAVRHRSRKRLAMLHATVERMQHDREASEAVRPFLPLLERFDGPGTQPLHGDINKGNVLLGPDRASCRILDYETGLYTIAPPGFDVAFAIERIAIQSGHGSERQAVLDLLASYSREARATPFGVDEDLPLLMALSSVRGLLLIAAAEIATGRVDRAERDKFLRNLSAVEQRRSMLIDAAAEIRVRVRDI
jgi:hypothetical protein